MALLASWSDANKRTVQGLSVKYRLSKGPVEYLIDGVLVDSYYVTRTAAKTYYYFGMTETAAKQCMAAKTAQYTRPYAALGGQENTQPVSLVECMTDISCSPDTNDGYAWKTTIQVNETDVKLSIGIPESPASLFSDENQRDYDEGNFSDLLAISSASHGTDNTVVHFTESIRNFDANRLVAELKADPNDTSWKSTVVTYMDPGVCRVPDIVAIGQTSVIRLVYGTITSSVAVIG